MREGLEEKRRIHRVMSQNIESTQVKLHSSASASTLAIVPKLTYIRERCLSKHCSSALTMKLNFSTLVVL